MQRQYVPQPRLAIAIREVLIDDDPFDEAEPWSCFDVRARAALDHHVGHDRRSRRGAADHAAAFKKFVELLFDQSSPIRFDNPVLIAAAEPYRRRLADR